MKIEVRPLLKIEAEVSGVTISAIVQDDWHIRIFGSENRVLNASSIKKEICYLLIFVMEDAMSG